MHKFDCFIQLCDFFSRRARETRPAGCCGGSTMVRSLGHIEGRVWMCLWRALGRAARRTAAHKVMVLYSPGRRDLDQDEPPSQQSPPPGTQPTVRARPQHHQTHHRTVRRPSIPQHPLVQSKAPAVKKIAWLPVGVNYNKPARGSVSLI